MDVPAYAALAAVVPLGVLGGIVFTPRASLGTAAWAATAAAAALALGVFALDPVALINAVAKGAWTGAWILLIVVPALLLFEVATAAGALDRLSDELSALTPTPGRRLLLLAWIFPSFLQGVAGYGTPVVVAAPMLVRAGMAPVPAVAAVMVGYHWSVTFGSMGSSFFVAAGTAALDDGQTAAFAIRAAGLLAVDGLAAGLLLLRRAEGRAREAVPAAVALGVIMGTTLIGVAAVQPALGSTAAGLAGLIAAAVLLPKRGSQARWRVLLAAATPYLLLTAMVVVAFGVPLVRELAGRIPALAPAFPASEAAFGHTNDAIGAHQPFRPLLHPAVYLIAAAGIGAVLYGLLGWLTGRQLRDVPSDWAARSRKVVVSLIGLTVLAGVMVDAGMIRALAEALTAGLGQVYIALTPLLGALGTIMTGSTTASNALVSPLQTQAADSLGASVAALLAGQTAGGNVGNALTPVNALVAAVAVGCAGREGAILRDAARHALPLLGLVTVGTVLLALLG